jgi:hypothetical protein
MVTFLIGLALVGVVAMVCVLGYRNLRRIKDKVDRGDARWEDDWDPFH